MIKARFIHIPKTAGTTVLSILNLQYLFNRKFIFSSNWQESVARWHSLSDIQRNKIRFVAGHTSHITGINEIDRAPAFTILRNPVERTISFCRHVLNPNKQHPIWHKGIRNLDMLLADPVDEMLNLQTKFLASATRQYGIMSNDDKRSNKALINDAKNTLDNGLAAFGIQECFDLSVIHIAEIYGWQPPVYLRRNVAANDNNLEFNKSHLERIEELNSLDIELYEWASRKFKAVTDSIYLRRKVKHFNKWQAIAKPLLSTHKWIRGN